MAEERDDERDDEGDEEQLKGGISNAGAVVRVGSHVLRPSNANSAAIHAYLTAVHEAGFTGASEPVDIDADGRERLVFIPGRAPGVPYPAWARTDEALASIGALVAGLHRASVGFDPTGRTWSPELADPAGGSVVGHNDICLDNVIFEGGRAVGLIDFDFAAPGRLLYDLAHCARLCVPIDDDETAAILGWTPADQPARLRLLADSYGLDAVGRAELLELVPVSMARARQFIQGRAEGGDANFIMIWDYLGGAERFARRDRWWVAHHDAFAAALA